MSFEQKLKQARDLWGAAKKKKPEYDSSIPDGVYSAKLVRSELGTSQSKGRLQVAMRAVISSGEYKGENVNWYPGLETENNIMFFQRDLVRLGKEVPEDPTELEGVLKELENEKPSIRIQLKTNGEFQNVRIMKVVDLEEEESEEPETEEEDEIEEEEVETVEEEIDGDEDKDDEEEEVEEEIEESEPEPEQEEEEEEEEEETQQEVEIGSRVSFPHEGKTMIGTIKEINYKKGLVTIVTDKGVKIKGVKPDDLSPAPTTKVKKSK